MFTGVHTSSSSFIGQVLASAGTLAFLFMKIWAESFYKSTAWQACRNSYLASVGGLCEDCLRRGEYTPAEIVHHIVPLTPQNIEDPNITLAWSNLRAVCRECHAKEHGARLRRYTLDDLGRVAPR